MLVLALGLGLVAFGLAGVRYAPAIVQAQHRKRMTPVDADEIDDEDRVRVTKGTAVVLVVVGVGLVAYAVLG